MVRLRQGRKNCGEHCHWPLMLEQEHPFIFLVFKCHPTHSTKLAFLPQALSDPIKRYFHGPVCPAQRMICHLTQTPITGLTPGSCDYGSVGPASPVSEGPPPVTRLRHSRPLQIRDNQPCQREGWASCLKHRHDRLIDCFP